MSHKLHLLNSAKALFACIAMSLSLSATAENPVISWGWGSTTTGYDWNAMRYATGYDGKVYSADKTNKGIRVFQSDGTNSLISSTKVVGVNITSDDNGNIVVSRGWAGNTSATNFSIYKRSNNTWHDLTVTMPSGVSATRTDLVGHVIGKIFAESGAMMFITPSGSNKIVVVYLKSGVVDSSKPAIAIDGPEEADFTTIAQPMCSYAEAKTMTAAQLKQNIAWRKRGTTSIYIYNGTKWVTVGLNNGTFDGTSCAQKSAEGFDVFSIAGEKYFVAPYGAKSYTTRLAIAPIGNLTGNVTRTPIYVSPADHEVSQGNPGFGGIFARQIDADHVELYQFAVTKENKTVCRMWRISAPVVLNPTITTVTPSFNATNREVTITWSGADLTNAAKYEVYEGETKVGESTTTSFTYAPTAEGDVTYTIKALDDDNAVIATSAATAFTIPYRPAIVLSITHTLGQNQATLSWEVRAIDNAAKFCLYRHVDENDELIETFEGANLNTTEYVDIVNGQYCKYFIVAFDADENEIVQSNSTASKYIGLPNVTITRAKEYEGRLTVSLRWTLNGYSKGISDYYNLYCDGAPVYKMLGYQTGTHTHVPAGDHVYQVELMKADGTRVTISEPVTVTVNPRDLSVVTYGLEEIYNYPIYSEAEAQAAGVNAADVITNNHLRLAAGAYGAPGDLYRQARFFNGNWYLTQLTDDATVAGNTTTKPYGPYVTNSGNFNKNGGIVAIDANDPKADIEDGMRRVIETPALINQTIAMDEPVVVKNEDGTRTETVNFALRGVPAGSQANSTTSNGYIFYLKPWYQDIYQATANYDATGHLTGSSISAPYQIDIKSAFDGITVSGATQEGRVHYSSASGNFASAEGGSIFLALNQSPYVLRSVIKNNTLDEVKKYQVPGSMITNNTYSTENYAFPLSKFSAENRAQYNDRYFIHQLRGIGNYLVDLESGDYTAFEEAGNSINTAGGKTFIYNDGTGEELFWIRPRSESSKGVGNFAIDLIDLRALENEENEDIQTFADAFSNTIPAQSFSQGALQTDGAGNANSVWFGTEYDEAENMINIYQYCPGTRFAKYRFYSYTNFPPARNPFIEIGYEKNGSEFRADDINRFSGVMSWQRPEKYAYSSAEHAYRLDHYIVRLTDGEEQIVPLTVGNGQNISFKYIKPNGVDEIALTAENNPTIEGAINVTDPGYLPEEGDLDLSKFVIVYNDDNLDNQRYTLNVTPVYVRTDNVGAVITGDTGVDDDRFDYEGAAAPLTVKSFKSVVEDNPYYRVDIDFDEPETDTFEPVSYYSIEWRKKGTEEFAPVADLWLVNGEQRLHYVAEQPQQAPAQVRAKAPAAQFNGQIPGTYNFFTVAGAQIPGEGGTATEDTTSKDYALGELREDGAEPCVAYLFTEEDPTEYDFQVTAHYAASNGYIAKDYTAVSSPTVSQLTGIEGVNASVAVSVFPNPAQSEVNVSSPVAIENIQFVDAKGAVVKVVDGNGATKQTINVTDLASGMYLMQVNNEAPVRVIKK